MAKGESQVQNSIPTSQIAEKLIDLNDLRIFAYVASLSSFSLAAEALQIHKSSVSRSIARLEAMLETPLLHRTTRKVLLTPPGIDLGERCVELLSRVDETIGSVGSIHAAPRCAAVRSGTDTPNLRTRAKSQGSTAERSSLRERGSLQGRAGAALAVRRPEAGHFGAAA